MIVEFFGLFDPYIPFLPVVVLMISFAGGLFAGTKINPAVGLLILGGAYVIDVMVSNSIVVKYGLDMDRFPVGIDAIVYGIIALGWMISGVFRAVSKTIRGVKRHKWGMGRNEKRSGG
jgi:hypothetical protein